MHLQGSLLLILWERQKRRCCRAAHQSVEWPVIILQQLICCQLPARYTPSIGNRRSPWCAVSHNILPEGHCCQKVKLRPGGATQLQ